MLLIDRHIIERFLANFLILFALLFFFAAAIDLILNMDEFVKVARDRAEGAGALARFLTLLGLMANFEAPRIFLFYAYMHGLIAIGAMAFTLAQMYRHRELAALLASGVSLHRLAMPFLAALFAVSAIQLLNQEFLMHRVAPLMLRGHGEIGQKSVEEFPVKFTDDGRGNLFQAASFNPATSALRYPTVLERDERGRTVRRITADEAVWDQDRGGWRLTNGAALALGEPDAPDPGSSLSRRPLDFYATDLDPRSVTVRRFGEYAAMLSLRQISQMLESPRLTDTENLRRHFYSRFAMVAVNVLVLFIALPSFLLREPASLMRQSLLCAMMVLPAMMGSAVGMMLDLPGITPAVGVFLPVIVLIPVVLARWTWFKT